MEKLEGWYGSKEYKEQTDFNEHELKDARFARIEDRLSAVVDWIIEREKRGGEPAPSENRNK